MKISDVPRNDMVNRHELAFASQLAFAGFTGPETESILAAWDGYDPKQSASSQRNSLVAFGLGHVRQAT